MYSSIQKSVYLCQKTDRQTDREAERQRGREAEGWTDIAPFYYVQAIDLANCIG